MPAKTAPHRIDHHYKKRNCSFFWLYTPASLSSLSCSYLDLLISPFSCLCFLPLFGLCAPALMTKLWLAIRIAGLSSAQRCSTLSSPTQRGPLPLLGLLLKSRVAVRPHGNHCICCKDKACLWKTDRNNTKSYLTLCIIFNVCVSERSKDSCRLVDKCCKKREVVMKIFTFDLMDM